ncbi:hypothetical protein SHO565_35460 [Streptomyces sp. HO565]
MQSARSGAADGVCDVMRCGSPCVCRAGPCLSLSGQTHYPLFWLSLSDCDAVTAGGDTPVQARCTGRVAILFRHPVHSLIS